jgi:hypothetical protein
MSRTKVELSEHGLFDERFYLTFRVASATVRDRVSVTFDDETFTSYAIESKREAPHVLNAVHRVIARMQSTPELTMLRAQL